MSDSPVYIEETQFSTCPRHSRARVDQPAEA
jgi:hypothetical protein